MSEKTSLKVNSTVLRTNFSGKSKNKKRTSFSDWIYYSLKKRHYLSFFSYVIVVKIGGIVIQSSSVFTSTVKEARSPEAISIAVWRLYVLRLHLPIPFITKIIRRWLIPAITLLLPGVNWNMVTSVRRSEKRPRSFCWTPRTLAFLQKKLEGFMITGSL